jgi:mannose-6-phosphate isomerase-like protein (cupin superfamily)
MALHRPATAPRTTRPEGVVAYLLASPVTDAAAHLTTFLVELRPGGRQPARTHPGEQVYFFLRGVGRLTLGAEQLVVGWGDCVFIPPGVAHRLVNVGDTPLAYFTAAAPAG